MTSISVIQRRLLVCGFAAGPCILRQSFGTLTGFHSRAKHTQHPYRAYHNHGNGSAQSRAPSVMTVSVLGAGMAAAAAYFLSRESEIKHEGKEIKYATRQEMRQVR